MMCNSPCPPGSFLDGVACASSCPAGTEPIGLVCQPQLPGLGREQIALLCTTLMIAGFGFLLYERRREGAAVR
jgi:hypothetical protein